MNDLDLTSTFGNSFSHIDHNVLHHMTKETASRDQDQNEKHVRNARECSLKPKTKDFFNLIHRRCHHFHH